MFSFITISNGIDFPTRVHFVDRARQVFACVPASVVERFLSKPHFLYFIETRLRPWSHCILLQCPEANDVNSTCIPQRALWHLVEYCLADTWGSSPATFAHDWTTGPYVVCSAMWSRYKSTSLRHLPTTLSRAVFIASIFTRLILKFPVALYFANPQ